MREEAKQDLRITVKEITGHCPVFRTGDTFLLREGYKLVSEIPVCMHSLASIMPYYNALRISDPARWGLGGGESAYLQCLDPQRYTHGGTVIFEITKV
jgi:uncharacterized repeat protein (TIGR04076 family)